MSPTFIYAVAFVLTAGLAFMVGFSYSIARRTERKARTDALILFETVAWGMATVLVVVAGVSTLGMW